MIKLKDFINKLNLYIYIVTYILPEIHKPFKYNKKHVSNSGHLLYNYLYPAGP